ncbi:MAG: hypothetical protein ACOCPM_01130 [Bacteroidales bacterium]
MNCWLKSRNQTYRKWSYGIFLFILGILIPLQGNAQFSLEDKSLDRKIRRSFHHLYNFQFSSAQKVLNGAADSLEADSWEYFALSNIHLWQIFAGAKDEEIQKKYRFYLDLQLQHSDKISNEKEARFLKIMHYTYLTRLTLNEKEYFSAFKAVSKYYSLLKPTFSDTTYAPYLLIDGLYYYLFSYAHKNYVLLRPFLSVYKQGDARKGIRYLKKAASSSNEIIRTEARYFLMKIYYEMESKPQKALPYARHLKSEYPGNFIFDFYYHQIQASLKQNYVADIKKVKDRIISKAELNKSHKHYFKTLLQEKYPN